MITLRIGGETHRFTGPNAQAEADAAIRNRDRAETRRPPVAKAPAAPRAPRGTRAGRVREIVAMLPPFGTKGMLMDDIAAGLKLSYWTTRELVQTLERERQVKGYRCGQRKRFTLPEVAQ